MMVMMTRKGADGLQKLRRGQRVGQVRCEPLRSRVEKLVGERQQRREVGGVLPHAALRQLLHAPVRVRPEFRRETPPELLE